MRKKTNTYTYSTSSTSGEIFYLYPIGYSLISLFVVVLVSNYELSVIELLILGQTSSLSYENRQFNRRTNC